MTRFFFLFLCLFPSFALIAQSDADSSQYFKGLTQLEKSVTAANYLDAAYYFESLSKDLPDQWLASYYVALSYILACQSALDSKTKDDLLDKAQKDIEKSLALNPGETELSILQAFLYQARLMIDPQTRAMNYSQKADAILKKVIQADPQNPRAFFLKACNVYYTPPVFKGGPKNALPLFLKAREKFKVFRPELSVYPNWGYKQNEEMIKLCNK